MTDIGRTAVLAKIHLTADANSIKIYLPIGATALCIIEDKPTIASSANIEKRAVCAIEDIASEVN